MRRLLLSGVLALVASSTPALAQQEAPAVEDAPRRAPEAPASEAPASEAPASEAPASEAPAPAPAAPAPEALAPPALEPEAPAKGGPVLTLEEVLASVEAHYPLLEAARLEREAAEAQLLAARGAFDPELRGRGAHIATGPYPYTRVETSVAQPTPLWGTQLFAGWRYGAGDIPVYAGQYKTNALGEVRAGISVPLWRNGPIDSRRAGVARARLGTEVADAVVVQARLDAARSGAQRYWDWVAAGRKLAVAQELLEIARVRDEALRRRVASGEVAAIERVDNVRALVQREGQVVAAERLLQQASIELSLFLRNEEGQPVLPQPQWLPPGFPEPRPAEALVGTVELERVLERRPDVQRLEASRAQQRVEERLASNQQAPLIDVTLAAARDMGPGEPRLGRPELEAGLVLDIPTLNRAATGRARSARASVARLSAQLQLQRERVAAEVRDTLGALEAARLRVQLARREHEVAREVEEAERKRFALGEGTLLIVNLREQASAEAAVRVVDALSDFFKSTAALRAVLALPSLEAAQAAAPEG